MRRLLFRNSVRVESGNCVLVDTPEIQPTILRFLAESENDEPEFSNEEILKVSNLESSHLQDYKENILVYISG